MARSSTSTERVPADDQAARGHLRPAETFGLEEQSVTMDSPKEGIACKTRKLPSGVIEITVLQGRSAWHHVARRLAIGRDGYLLANFRRAAIPLPQSVLPESDCFSRAPAEIRDTDSLHVFTLDCGRPKAPLIDTLADADAGMTIFSNRDAESLMTGQQILWAWFSRPSLLISQFTNGSADLAMRLLELPQVILIETPSDGLCVFAMEPLAVEVVAHLSPGATASP